MVQPGWEAAILVIDKPSREPMFESEPPGPRFCNVCGKMFMSDGLRSCPACTYAKQQMVTPRRLPAQPRRLKKATDE